MVGTILQQGNFTVPATATGTGVVPVQMIQIPSGADYIWVRNFTQTGVTGSQTPAIGYEYYWQYGMAPATAFVRYNTNAALTAQDDIMITNGITVVNPGGATQEPVVGPSFATTGTTNVTRPVVTVAAGVIASAGIQIGSYVQKYDAQTNINGIPMEVSAVTATTFTLLSATDALQQAPGVAGGVGSFRVVSYPMFYPNDVYITNITPETGLITVSTSSQHGLTPGQVIRFQIPSLFKSQELNSNSFNNYQTFTIQTVGAAGDTFTVNAPVGGITMFVFPTAAQFAVPSDYAIVVPVGEDSASALFVNPVNLQVQTPIRNLLQVNGTQTGFLSDARTNTSFQFAYLGAIGATPAGGTNTTVSGPAGYAAGDVVFWVAGKSEVGGS